MTFLRYALLAFAFAALAFLPVLFTGCATPRPCKIEGVTLDLRENCAAAAYECRVHRGSMPDAGPRSETFLGPCACADYATKTIVLGETGHAGHEVEHFRSHFCREKKPG